MGRMNDVGGLEGFGPIDVTDDAEPFHADWEARVFALHGALLQAGVYHLDEFRDAIERMPVADYLAAGYYERWFEAIRTLLAEKGVATPEELALPPDLGSTDPGAADPGTADPGARPGTGAPG